MIEMCIINRGEHIPVDKWDTEEYPIDDKDKIFRNIKGEIILPISEMFYNNDDKKKSLDYFVMNPKRSYNSDDNREHICRYLNYFEKYYDIGKELISIMHKIKINIDYIRNYDKENFMDDINRYIIRNNNIGYKIRHFVDDNYMIKLSSNNNKTPNLQYNSTHAKVLYEISLLMNMYIPLATHYMYIHSIRTSDKVKNFMLNLFDMCMIKYEQERGIYIYDKIYETAKSIVNKSKSTDRPLWGKNKIRGNNPTTHIKESVIDIIMNIIPKYSYDNNVINFNYFSNRQSLKFKITDIKYEYQLCKISSSKRDADQNSEYDRYEARLNKKDGALELQNKVSAEQTVNKIEALYGPFAEEEIEHYRNKLTINGAPCINSFQMQLIAYLFDKDFGDQITILSVHNRTDYIKLIIAAKRILLKSGMVILPYIISGRIIRISTRKVISKKDLVSIQSSPLYKNLQEKYRNPKIEQKICEFIGAIMSSSFEIIDYDVENHKPTEYDGKIVPMINDILKEELMFFITLI